MKIEIAIELIDLFVPADKREAATRWLALNQLGHGGRRPGAGAPKGNKNRKKINQDNLIEPVKPTVELKKNNQDVLIGVKKPTDSKNELVVQDKDLSAATFSAGFQGWEFPKQILAEAKKHWTPATIRNIERDFSCQEYETITSVAKLLEEYPADTQDATIDIAFTTFWDAYPKQRAGSKPKAKQKFISIVKSKYATIEELLDGVQRYRISDEVARGFAKGCAAWLNDDRWKHDYKPAAAIKTINQARQLAEWAKK